MSTERANQLSSVAQSCPTLCDLMDCRTTGFPVHHQLPGACSNSCPLSQRYHPTISSSVDPFSSCLQSFPASGSCDIKNWIKDLLSMAPIKTRPSFPHSQSLPPGSFHKPLILIHQRADQTKTTITEN